MSKPLDLASKSALLTNLVFLYHTMKASENLLTVAAGCADGAMRDYFVNHLFEERGHLEWLADDLESEGIEARETPVPRLAVEMVGSIYYLVQHVDPSALLGYMVLMECFPMPVERVEALEELHGKQLLRTTRFHAEHDVDHGRDVLALIDSLSEREQGIAYQSAVQSARYFSAATHSFI